MFFGSLLYPVLPSFVYSFFQCIADDATTPLNTPQCTRCMLHFHYAGNLTLSFLKANGRPPTINLTSIAAESPRAAMPPPPRLGSHQYRGPDRGSDRGLRVPSSPAVFIEARLRTSTDTESADFTAHGSQYYFFFYVFLSFFLFSISFSSPFLSLPRPSPPPNTCRHLA